MDCSQNIVVIKNQQIKLNLLIFVKHTEQGLTRSSLQTQVTLSKAHEQMRNDKTYRFNHTTIWIRLPPCFTIILPIGSVKVSITDSSITTIFRVRISITTRQSGSEVGLVVSTFITLTHTVVILQ